jgi:vancomycin resistance protein YoaR
VKSPAIRNIVRKLKAYLQRYARPLVYFAGAVLIVSTGYHLYFANKIIPGVVLAGVNIGGLDPKQALSKVVQQETQTEKILKLWAQNGKVYQLKSDDIELKYDWEAGVARALEVGRTGRFIVDTKDKLAGLVKPLKINALYTFNKDLLGGKVAEIRSGENIPAISAKIALTAEEKVEIVPEVYGKSLDEDKIYDAVRASLDSMVFDQKSLAVENDNPQFTKQDLEQVLNETQKLVGRQIALTSGNKRYVLGPQDLIKLVKFSKNDEQLQIKVDKDALTKIRDDIGQDLNKLPLGQVEEIVDGRVTEFKIIQNGLEIDETKFSDEFKQVFTEGGLAMEIPLKEIKTSKDGSEYGIFALLGTGVSKFTGSAQPRITNLTLAAKRLNGVLVPPGEEFSFNKTVGEISGKTGYATAYIIASGRTVLGEGGGVCQTSTTLFRAVLNTGLPITSRHPHAYRVSYYELESPVGFDASVYQPSLDFKFINNTPGHILIQSFANLTDNTLEFKLYGTPDGRKVEFSEPKLYNVVGAPASLYQDDPTLAKGVVKQVDFSAPGGTAEFSRKVTKGDEVLFEDSFKTIYQPWRAIFLVGTK